MTTNLVPASVPDCQWICRIGYADQWPGRSTDVTCHCSACMVVCMLFVADSNAVSCDMSLVARLFVCFLLTCTCHIYVSYMCTRAAYAMVHACMHESSLCMFAPDSVFSDRVS